ncbi:MAG: AAA family ATPase [Chloroflexota bacterium]|nr:AAA family ATPase [Chloroflexota bacterium]
MEPASKIESIKIQGFRSLADVELTDLPNAAVLIGPNGSGKSNIFLFLEMLRQMLRYRRLGEFVARHGGADDQLFGGSARTPELAASLAIKISQDRHTYSFTLGFAQSDKLEFNEESFSSRLVSGLSDVGWAYSGGGTESGIMSLERDGFLKDKDRSKVDDPVILATVTSRSDIRDFFGILAFHQFHNTDFNSNIKKSWDVTDNVRLRADGGNLAAVLYRLEREDTKRYDYICGLVNRILPTFDRFDLEESYGKVLLRWKAKGSDKTMGAHLTSDGSLRYFCLVTLLNLPEEMLPSVILLDEPELGLHPSAVGLVGAMIKRMSRHRQVIVATQSPLMLNEFDLGEVYVFDLKDGRTRIHRPDEEWLVNWVEEYSTGEIWLTNLIGGRPWSDWP